MPRASVRSEARRAERNDPIDRVVADIGAAAEGDAGARAPILDDGRFVAAECRLVGGNIAYSAEADSSYRTDVGTGRQMKHGAVDPVMVLADFFDEQVGSRKVGFE